MLRLAVVPKLAAGGVPTKSPTRSRNKAKQDSQAHWELIAGALMLQPGQRKDRAQTELFGPSWTELFVSDH